MAQNDGYVKKQKTKMNVKKGKQDNIRKFWIRQYIKRSRKLPRNEEYV